jgi:hypothetical protein
LSFFQRYQAPIFLNWQHHSRYQPPSALHYFIASMNDLLLSAGPVTLNSLKEHFIVRHIRVWLESYRNWSSRCHFGSSLIQLSHDKNIIPTTLIPATKYLERTFLTILIWCRDSANML